MAKVRQTPIIIKIVYYVFMIIGIFIMSSGILGILLNKETLGKTPELVSSLPFLDATLLFFEHAWFPVILILTALFRVGIRSGSPQEFRALLVLMLFASLAWFGAGYVYPLISSSESLTDGMQMTFAREGEDYHESALKGPREAVPDQEKEKVFAAERARRIAEDAYRFYGEIIEYKTLDGIISPYMPDKGDYDFRKNVVMYSVVRTVRLFLMPWLISLHLASILCVVMVWKSPLPET